ncbi:YtzH-like family protein [Bacillus benzoevorans]|uniref:Putative Zn-dependent peptidase n=1 Tax=Bacillus benzoevorans TaxID=1456 RepID=A0A7X0LV89_9BACI|nr:YtzH-like family protein [Bacillus benzoevorans]MBB6445751.1 putative Zn-dependent peptidase [Bacillus benzoevorans]
MPLQYNDQVNILKDILMNHQTDCCGSVSECEQMERLIKSLLTNANIDQSNKSVLEQIYSYSQNGKNSANLDQHIESHQQQLSQWVDHMDQFS